MADLDFRSGEFDTHFLRRFIKNSDDII